MLKATDLEMWLNLASPLTSLYWICMAGRMHPPAPPLSIHILPITLLITLSLLAVLLLSYNTRANAQSKYVYEHDKAD